MSTEKLIDLNTRLGNNRKAQQSLKRLTSVPASDVRVSLDLHWMERPSYNYVTDQFLTQYVTDRIRASLPALMDEAAQKMKENESKLCEEIVVMTAKTVASGL